MSKGLKEETDKALEYWARNVLGRWGGKWETPEAAALLACLRNSTAATLA